MRRLLIIAALGFAALPARADFQAHPVRKESLHAVRPHPPKRITHRRVAASLGAGGFTVLASYYGGGEYLNARTATGERFRASGLTAAHRTLPFGTRLNVCFARCVVVRVNDRGPARWTGRDLDLSRGAAGASGLLKAGVGRVSVTRL